jgi:peptide/nickel transport system permease protein
MTIWDLRLRLASARFTRPGLPVQERQPVAQSWRELPGRVKAARQTGGPQVVISAGGALGGAIVAGLLLVALLAPVLTPYPADLMVPADRLLPPGAAHPFGTDGLGRDLFSRVAFGARLAVQMAVLAVGMSAVAGLVLGSLAGYHGGRLDYLLARLVDAWLSLPGVLVAIVVVARLGPSLSNLILALGFMGVPAYFRLVRGMTLSARRELYVEAARLTGASDGRVMWRHILPNIASPLIVQTTLRLGIVLLTGGSLSFVGLGAQPPTPEWGALLASGRGAMDTAWWLAVFPGMAITMTVLGFNMLGDGLRDALDPRMKEQGAR